MKRRPPTSTFFPYATLFRYPGLRHRDDRAGGEPRRAHERAAARLAPACRPARPACRHEPPRRPLADEARAAAGPAPAGWERTRFDSKHTKIFYSALFFIKKK